MLQAVHNRAAAVRAADPQGRTTFHVYPIIGESHDEPSYRVLSRKEFDAVTITEIDEHGSVPSLKVTNTLDERVYLMDGQELIGAKQNRILNTDVLIPAGATVIIPVSCVEAGRWRYTTMTFRPGRSASSHMRRRKMRRVHNSLREKRGHDADQGEVWSDVDETLAQSKAMSPSAAMHAAYEQRDQDLRAFREQFTMPEDAVGLAVFHREHLLGLDLFDRHSTLMHFWELLLDSYAIDWAFVDPEDIAQGDPAASPSASAVQELLEHGAAGAWEHFESPGEGADYRLSDSRLCGSALVWDERIAVDVQLFPADSR